MSRAKKNLLCGIVLVALVIGLNLYLIGLALPIAQLKVIGIVEVGIGICLVLTYFNIKQELQKIMEDLSALIRQIIVSNGEEVFMPLKDEMPSKLQVEVNRLSEILRRQKEDVVAEKEGIESLLGDIAHQLKTPLTNVGMYAEILEDQELDEESYNMFYSGLRGEVDRLNFLVETLIKMSRLEGGVIKLHSVEANLQETCLNAIKSIHIKAASKEIELQFKGHDNLMTTHDTKWTAEAIGNILDNAVKYSKEKTCIKMELIPYEMFVRIDIQDEGIGVSEEELTYIFKRFYRGENVYEEEGVGIGLYLARKIIGEQGGYIKVKSEVGKGSMFSVFLPLCKM